MRRRQAVIAVWVAFSFTMALGKAEENVKETTFTLKPQQGVMGSLVRYYMPIRVQLSEKASETLAKEPAYQSDKPLYGALKLGNGADSLVTIVVDEPSDGIPHFFVDANNDEDLTNDGDGQWTRTAGSTLGLSNVLIDVSYKKDTVPYTFDFYRFKERLRDFVLYYRNAGRTGEMFSGGKSYKIVLFDENADALFDDLEHGTLVIDLDQDGDLEANSDSAERHALAEPFNVHGQVWQVASLSPDGTKLELEPSAAKVEMKRRLEVGFAAPAFTAETLDGKPIDLKKQAQETKVVLLDFWASWCGPCLREFPHLRRVQARFKDHGFQIIGISLDEDQERARLAVQENELDYPHVFDGKGWQNEVAMLYRVKGIPQTFLLDKDLMIVARDLRGPVMEKKLVELLGEGDVQTGTKE